MKKFKSIISLLLTTVMIFTACFVASAANDTFDNALPIEFSQEYTGEISKSDAWNYYKIILPEAGKLKVDILAFINVYYDLYGQNKDGILFNDVDISFSPGFRNKTVNVYLTAGVYYFAMHNQNNWFGEYNITFNFESANETVPESYGGSNETLNTASEIELNKKYYGVVAKNESYDFYKFNLKEKNKVKIKFHTDASSWVQFYNSKGAEIYGNSSVNNNYGATGNCVLEYELDAGNYYYVVRSTNGIYSTYSLIVECEELLPKYILSYDANGGTGAPASQSGATTYTVSSNVPTRSGYTFLGWSKSSSATTATYTAGNSITLTANTTLYAVWEKIPETTYVLSYDANGGSGAPSFQYGATTYTISSTVPVRDDYTFLGWSKDKNATTASYTAGSTITLTEHTTLYAVWKKKVTTTYFLFYDANGGTGAPAYQYNSTSYIISDVAPVRSGYVFLGWSKDKNATTASYKAGNSITLTANVTLYAVWEKIPETTYILSYDANGGYGAPASQTGASTYTVSSVIPVRDGYMFLGWSTYSGATTASYAGGSAIALSGNTTLYAVWKANPTYTCDYCGSIFRDVNAYTTHVKTHEEKPVDVTIEGGTIVSGDKTPGSIVTIIAEQIDGKIFKRWIVSGAKVTDAYAAETTIIIGEGDVVITADYDECTCGCHQTGISGFFAKIVIFFQKLFGSNAVCLCGKYH